MTRTVRTLCAVAAALVLAVGFFYQPEKTVQERNDNIWLICLGVAGVMLVGLFWVGRLPVSRDADPDDRLRHNVQRISSLLVVGFILMSLQLLRQQVVVA